MGAWRGWMEGRMAWAPIHPSNRPSCSAGLAFPTAQPPPVRPIAMGPACPPAAAKPRAAHSGRSRGPEEGVLSGYNGQGGYDSAAAVELQSQLALPSSRRTPTRLGIALHARFAKGPFF
eukprot:scaffold3664_cov407-Prasinococcus_capsulatus_cf.AAC.19